MPASLHEYSVSEGTNHRMCDGGGISTIMEEDEYHHTNPLHVAVHDNDVTQVKRLLAKGADPNAQDDFGGTPLHLAVFHNLLPTVQVLVEHHRTNCDIQNKVGKTSLHVAIETGYFTIASCLIEHGASLDIRDELDLVALDYCYSMREPLPSDEAHRNFFMRHISDLSKVHLKSKRMLGCILAYWDNPELLQTIIETDKSVVRFQDKHKQTPLHYCFSGENHISVQSARILISNGADVNDRNIDGATPLDFLAAHDLCGDRNATKFVSHVITTHAQLEDMSPLHLAAVAGDVDLLKYAAECGVNLNLQDKDGFTALHLGALHGQSDVVRALLKRGSEVNPENQRGQIPLHYSSVLTRITCSLILLHDGAFINHKDQFGMSPLHKAGGWGTAEMVKLFIQKNADVNIKDNMGQLPIHYSALKGLTDITEILILKGSQVGCEDQNGQTPLHLAAKTGHVEVIKLLLLHKGDPNAQDIRGQSPMHLACWHGHKEAVQTLINRGASKNVVTAEGQTPSQFASERGYYGILSTLREHRQSLSLYAPEQLKTFEMFRNMTAPTRLESLGQEESEAEEEEISCKQPGPIMETHTSEDVGQRNSNGDVRLRANTSNQRGDVNANLRMKELSSEPEESSVIYMKPTRAEQSSTCTHCCVLS